MGCASLPAGLVISIPSMMPLTLMASSSQSGERQRVVGPDTEVIFDRLYI